MTLHSSEKTDRNDPCPCGSGKKYKRCCLQQEAASESIWLRQREASDRLTRDMMQFAARKFGKQVEDAWQDFNMTDLPVPFADTSLEDQIFMPYFLYDWDPERSARGWSPIGRDGLVTRRYKMEKSGWLSESELLFLDEATTRPLSFYEVLWSEPGRRLAIRCILTGQVDEVVERSASRILKQGDITYSQVWHLPGLAILGRCAPIRIPPGRKADVIALRKKLQRRIARQNRELAASDLLRYADDVRETYLDIRDSFHVPPRFCNTDGDPLVFHTLTYTIQSPAAVFDALAPLALGRSKAHLLSDAEFDQSGKLRSVVFDWLKKGNRKMTSWDNTILGHIRISENLIVAEVNSKARADRFRREIEKRLGAGATHQNTVARTPEEMLKNLPKRDDARPELDDEILRDPEVRNWAQQTLQKQVEAWVHQKIPILGNRTPIDAVRDPDGREIIESLLLDWERRAKEGAYQPGIRPDFNAVRKLLKLPPSAVPS